MFSSFVDPWYKMSGGNNNLSKAKNGSRGKCGNIAHPNSVHTDLNLL